MKKSLIALLFLLLTASCGGNSENEPPAQPVPPAPGPTVAELLARDLVGLALDDFYFES